MIYTGKGGVKMELMDFFLWVGIIFGTIFIIQTIMTFMGMGDYDVEVPNVDGMLDMDALDSGFPILTIKNLVVFGTMFGFTGMACVKNGVSEKNSVIIALMVGIAMMLIVAYLYYYLRKMGEEGNVKVEDSIGKTGTVYLKIPGENSGKGKVNVTLQGGIREFFAVTDGGEIATGKLVVVLDVIGDNILKVK